jgi:anthranilate synthase component 2
MNILIIDNYDSFTYNLVHYFGDIGCTSQVYRNDCISPDEVIKSNPDAVIISPGPSNPNNAGICLDLVAKCHKHQLPLLGICLGHQCIGQSFQAKIIQAPEPIHGKVDNILHDGHPLFKGQSMPFRATRYHSLIIDSLSMPSSLQAIAKTEDDIIMAVAHVSSPIFGIQFHPESIATEGGHAILTNFLNIIQ